MLLSSKEPPFTFLGVVRVSLLCLHHSIQITLPVETEKRKKYFKL